MTELKIRLGFMILSAWRRRWTILLPMLLMPLVAYGVSKLAATRYTAHTSMLIQETAKMNPFLQDIAVSSGLNDRLNAVKTLLKSRHVLSLVATELDMINDATPPAERERVIKKIASSLRVVQLGKDLLKIEYTSRSPEGMQTILQSLSRHFIEQLLAPERSSIQDSRQFLSQHIDKRFSDLQAAEQALADYTNVHSALTPELQSQSYARIAVLKQTLAEKQAELYGVERSLGTIDQQLSSTNPVVGRLEEQIIETRSALTLLQAKYTDTHSAVQAKQRELSRLERERETLLNSQQPGLDSRQLWDMVSSQKVGASTNGQPLLISQLHDLQQIRGRFAALTEETSQLTRMITDLEQKTRGFGDNVKQIFRLQRNVELKRQLYEQLLERYEMAELTGSLGVFEQNKRVKIIDLPYTPSAPANLPAVVFVVAGLIGGAALGIGLAVVLELFDSTIRNVHDIQQVTLIPVMGVISHDESAVPHFDSQADTAGVN